MTEDRLTPEHGESSLAYLFEAKGIQRYVFDSGRLRDLVGASNLVAELASTPAGEDVDEGTGGSALVGELRDLVGRVCDVTGIAPEFSRRAGGSFCFHSDDRSSLDGLRALWRLAAQLRCPGLEMSDSEGEVAVGPPPPGDPALAAMRVAYRCSGGIRDNSAASLPPSGHPLTFFVPRTGRPATGLAPYEGDPVYADAVTAPQRRWGEAHRDEDDPLARRFLGSERGEQQGKIPYRFPRNVDPSEDDTLGNPAFPFSGEDKRLAVVHADISGLGELFLSVPDLAGDRKAVRELGDAIASAIDAAAAAATKSVLLPRRRIQRYGKRREPIAVIPARPIVLGGDDITILTRADVAMPFAAALLEAIESETEKRLGSFAWAQLPGGRLSACAGIAVFKNGLSFAIANELAADLCKVAKAKAKEKDKPYPSALAFHVMGTSMQEAYDDILRSEMKAGGIALTANPYGVGEKKKEVGNGPFEALDGIARELDKAPAGLGSLRDMRRLIQGDRNAAESEWMRWREKVRDRSGDDALSEVDGRLNKFGVNAASTTFLREGSAPVTPLFDALELIDLGALREPEGKENDDPDAGSEAQPQ